MTHAYARLLRSEGNGRETHRERTAKQRSHAQYFCVLFQNRTTEKRRVHNALRMTRREL